MKFRKTSQVMVLLLTVILLISSCNGGTTTTTQPATSGAAPTTPPEPEKVITIATPYTIGTFSPYMYQGDGDRYISSNCYEVLVVNATPHYLPGIASSWDTPDDLTYIFHLRDNVYWQRGNPLFGDELVKVTANDVKAVFDFVMDPANGARQQSEAVTYFKSWEVIDELTIKLTANFPSALTLYSVTNILIWPVKAVQEKNFNLDDYPIGSGPYKFENYRIDDQITMVRNEDFRIWPNLDRVVFKIVPDKTVAAIALMNKEVDIVPQLLTTDLEAVAAKDYLALIPNEIGWYRYIGVNTLKPAFADIRVREAMSMAIDFDSIVDAIYYNPSGAMLALNTYGGAVPLEHEGADLETWKKYYEYNPEKAVAILEEAGWQKGTDGIYAKDGMKLEFVIKTPANDQNRMKAGEMAATYLKVIGINAIPQPTEWATFLDDIREGNTELFIMGGGSVVGGMNMLFHSERAKGQAHNTWIEDTHLDDLLDRGYSTIDIPTRLGILKEASTYALQLRVHLGGYLEYVQNGMNTRVTDYAEWPSFWYGLTTEHRNMDVTR